MNKFKNKNIIPVSINESKSLDELQKVRDKGYETKVPK